MVLSTLITTENTENALRQSQIRTLLIDRELLTKYLPVAIAAAAVEDRNVVVHQLDTKYFG
jgi:hypothetical protein